MNLAIIPAAGSGLRLGGPIPKQFLESAGAPVLAHTIRRFYECADIHAIVVALPADKIAEFQTRDAHVGLLKPIIYVSGGQERSDSILNALNAAASLKPEIVAVHDAVRPFVTPAQISAVMRAPMRPVSTSAISSGPSSRTILWRAMSPTTESCTPGKS